jgi:delta24-sterol reductase
MISLVVDHTQKVEKIQREIKQKCREVSLLSKNASNTLRNGANKKRADAIDLSSFNEILAIDEENLVALVEPKVTFRELCAHTLKKGLLPLVVPEFPSITVGGAIMGSALESSSHIHGQFNDSCIEMEFLCGDGAILALSPNENADLFYGLSGSYGTLGVLTLVKIKLKKACKYVRLNYHVFSTSQEILTFFQESKNDFVEGIALSENRFIGIEAHMTEERETLPTLSQASHASKWFIDHVTHVKEGDQEIMLTKEYLFRLDRGAFWVGGYLQKLSYLLKIFLKTNEESIALDIKKNPLSYPTFAFRLLFGWVYSSKNLYKIWHRTPRRILENLFFIHDFYLPVENFLQGFSFFQKKTKIFPIWLCPIKGTQKSQFLSPHFGKEAYINMGFYGIPPEGDVKKLTDELEREIVHFGGRKMLYSFSSYRLEEFSKIYDLERLEALRKKYGAVGRFPSLYEKVCS